MKKEPQFISLMVNLLTILMAAIMMSANQSAKAANGNDTWAGDGGNASWSTAGNWATGSINKPPVGGDSLIFITNGASGGLLNNDIAASTAFNAITFNDGADDFTFSGNAINLAGNITDNAINTETINFPMAMTATRTFIVTNGGNLVVGGVISGTSGTSGITFNKTTAVGNKITPFNTGTLAMNGSAANTYTGPTVVNGGTLLLDFANMATPTDLINSSSALTLGGLGGGTLSIKGRSSGSTSQTLGNLTLGKNTGSAIVIDPNGGTGTTLTLGNTWNRSGGACSLNIDLSSGGTLVSTPTSVAANGVLGFATVKDATGVGFASLSGGNIVRLTGQETLPTSGTDGTVNYITSGNVTMASAGFGVNSLTLDASSGSGVLDLGGASDVMLISSIGLLMYGGNDYTITNGQVGAANVELLIHQMGTGTLTIDGTVGSGSTAGITKNGTGTLVLNNTNSSAYIVINQGTVRQGVANAVGATNESFTVNYGGTMDLNGYDLSVGAVANSGAGEGIVTNSGNLANFTVGVGNGAPDLANTLVCGPINIIVTGSGSLGLSPANTHTGGTTFDHNSGAPQVYRINDPSELGTGPMGFNGGGTIQNTTSLTITNAVVVNDVGNAWWVDSGAYGSSGPWTGTGTINVLQDNNKSSSFTFSGDMSGFQGTLQLTGNTNTSAANVTLNYLLNSASAFDGSHATWNVYSVLGTFSSLPVLQWAGTGSQTIKLGDLNSSGTTGDRTPILTNGVAGTTATFEVGNLNQNSSFAGALVTGAGEIALTKTGTGTWNLSGANTYTGATIVSNGTLQVDGSLASVGTVSVNGGTLAGIGAIGSLIVDDGTLAPGDAGVGTLAVGGDITLNSASTNVFEVNGSTPANDMVVADGNVTYGGLLQVVASGSFTVGQQFVLFQGAGATNSSNFAGITGSPGAGMAFSFTNGVLSVVSAGSGPILTSATPNPVAGSSYAVTLGLDGSGFTGATAVLLTNLTSSTGASYAPTVNSDTSISVSFVPGTAASSWNATVVNGTSSSQVGFTVSAATTVSINNNLTAAGAGKLVLSGSGMTPNYSYSILSATNLNSPVTWTPIVTNTANGSGDFYYTNTVNVAAPQLFLRIQQ